MSTQSEAQLESALISRLQGKGWAPVAIDGADGLWANLRAQLGKQNGITFSDAEFAQIRHHLKDGGVFKKASILRGRCKVERDDGTVTHIRFFNSDEWCRNQYQIASQIELTGTRTNRYDVTLLVNGFPLCQIELKRRGIEMAEAFRQINRYHKDSFKDAADGLFEYVQVFVISNGTNTRYFANNKNQGFEHTFTWSDVENNSITRIEPFADIFLEKCHLSKMIARYIVPRPLDKDGRNGTMMILRPYQYHAAEAILERAKTRQGGGGYIWHATGSGKTLTSFKAAQNVAALDEVDQVIFVVDRSDLDAQTTEEFNLMSRVPIGSTEDTRELVDHMTDRTIGNKLIVTTIQKLNIAVTRHGRALEAEGVADQRIILIFDECHRSQFGGSHRRIRNFFQNVQMFGFTGTPILAENASGERTTESLFGKRLHAYTIMDAIRDRNVLKFSIEYIGEKEGAPAVTGDEKKDKAALAEHRKLISSRPWLDHPDRIGGVVDWILENHDRKSHNRIFGAIMATGSTEAAILYFDEFQRRRSAGDHTLNIATVFTYGPNEEDPDADGLIPGEDHIPQATKRDRLVDFSNHYNDLFGVNTSVLDGEGFRIYNRSIAKRLKARDIKDMPKSDGIDILIVVAMYLTGFDAKTLNTLYVDKSLRYHGLIQAFSRTNRVLNESKSHGNIVCFRDLRENTDEAIALFADKDAQATIFTRSYAEYVEEAGKAVEALRRITPDPDMVDDLVSDEEREAFAKAFRELLRARKRMEDFSEYDPDDIPIPAMEMADFQSKYVDMSMPRQTDDLDRTLLDAMDFELGLIHSVEINLAYILKLLVDLGRANGDEAEARRAAILEILMSDPGMRNKRPFIEEFIDKRMPNLDQDADFRMAFQAYWDVARARSFSAFISENRLAPAIFWKLHRDILCSGKRPSIDDVVNAMKTRPKPLMRKKSADRIISGIIDLIDTFDDVDLQ